MNEEPTRSKSLEYSLGIFIVLGLVAAFFIWQDVKMKRHGRGHVQSEATSNARQIGLALLEFETEYGAFPNDSTKVLVEKDFGTAIDLSGSSSNALFRQLFAVEFTQSESIFYARTNGSRKPDGDITPGRILEPNSCGFSYITGLTSKDDPGTPIVLTPLIPGTTKFDPKPFDGKAVVLRIDNSVRTYDIAKDGHIYDDKGINLLSSKNPIWKGKAPDIRYPE